MRSYRPWLGLLTVRVAHRGPRADPRAGHAGRPGGLDPEGGQQYCAGRFWDVLYCWNTWAIADRMLFGPKIQQVTGVLAEIPESGRHMLENLMKIIDVQKRPTRTYATIIRLGWTFLNDRGKFGGIAQCISRLR